MPILKKQKMQEEEEKYHCRLCDERFSSGRALGGHMRVHGMFNIEPIIHQNGGPSTTGSEGESFDGNRLLTSHICQNCGKEFCSLKSLSKHCCHGLVGADRDDGENDNSNGLFSPSLPRSKTPSPPLVPTEDEHVANYLVWLSTSHANPVLRNTDGAECSSSVLRITGRGECSTSERREADYVVLLPPSPQPENLEPHVSTQTPPNVQIFECKTCQKLFKSHQALGGHRASHKKVRGCFATRLEIKSPKLMKCTSIEDDSNNIIHQNNQAGFSHQNNEDESSSENMALAIVSFVGTSSHLSLSKKHPKVHECSVCKRQFPSGQALGGHMRCHRRASSSRGTTVEPASVVATELQAENSSSGLNNIHPHTLMSPEVTLCLDMPGTTVYVQPGRENTRENTLNVNIEEVQSMEVRLNDLSDLLDINEREVGSTWLQIGLESISKQETREDQP